MRVWFALFLVLAQIAAAAAGLPPKLFPPAPFPKIVTDALTREFVAPGIEYANYSIFTASGPLQVHIVSVDLRNRSVRIDTVLAHDSLTSAGETTSSMAVRTHAVAAINGDYFDIGATNRPLGGVVQHGFLLKSPNAHGEFTLFANQQVSFLPQDLGATVQIGAQAAVPLAINEFPPAAITLYTPQFGSIPAPARSDATIATLEPLDGAYKRFRVTAVASSGALAPQYALFIGTQELAPPAIGDVVTVTPSRTPLVAVGGGPLLLHAGARYSEPNAPAAAEGRSRIPISAVGLTPQDDLLLVEVDGRQPDYSIGLNREEFTSLLIALGCTEGLSFDGGGSSTLVTRELGDAQPSVRNSPSDGTERAVADGLFIYSDAPSGAPAELVLRPAMIRALAGSVVDVHRFVTDAAGHTLAHLTDVRINATHPGRITQLLRYENLRARLPVIVEDRVGRLEIRPQRAHVLTAGGSLQFSVRAFDPDGYELALPSSLAWSARNGQISSTGLFRAEQNPADVRLRIADASASQSVTVGEHEEPQAFSEQWKFVSLPAGGGGSAGYDQDCSGCLGMDYDFSAGMRAANLIADQRLPDDILGLRFDILEDGSNNAVHVVLTNAINERVLLNAGKLSHQGWQSMEVRFPSTLSVPAMLHSIYLTHARDGVHSGHVTLRNLRLIAPGEPQRH